MAQDAAERGVGFVVRKHPDNSLEAFLEEAGAALLVGDENPCREPERWRRVLAKRLKLPYWTVDADVVVPSRVFDRSFVLLHHFRPHLKAELPKYLVAPKKIEPAARVETRKALPSFRSLRRHHRGVSRSSTARSGRWTALPEARMRRSSGSKISSNLELKDYEDTRNHPE
jgi:deoxyribodipyrimidine photo-lyase